MDVPCKNIGSLVVGFSEEDDRTIEMLYKRGVQNGVENQRIIKQPELSVMEPNLNPDCTSAFYMHQVHVLSILGSLRSH